MFLLLSLNLPRRSALKSMNESFIFFIVFLFSSDILLINSSVWRVFVFSCAISFSKSLLLFLISKTSNLSQLSFPKFQWHSASLFYGGERGNSYKIDQDCPFIKLIWKWWEDNFSKMFPQRASTKLDCLWRTNAFNKSKQIFSTQMEMTWFNIQKFSSG